MKKPAPNIVGELKANGNGVVAFGYPLKRLGLRPPVPSCGGQAIPEETRDESVGQPQSEKRKESFMPVEITGAWFRAEKGIGGRIVLGWFPPGPFDSQDELFDSQGELKPRPPKERGRGDPGLPPVELVARTWGLIEV